MKQRKKVNAIVKRLYELKDDRYSHSLTEIMEDLNIYESEEDMERMATSLEGKGFVKLIKMKGGIDIKIFGPGIDYYDDYLSSTMSEQGKLMAILEWLYDRRHEGVRHIELEIIMQELGIYESRPEAERLVDEMVELNLVDLQPIEDGVALVRQITNNGIKYLKGKGTGSSEKGSIGQQINFQGGFNAVNAAIGKVSHVQQTATINSQAEDLISKIRKGIEASKDIDRDQMTDLLESVNDIEKRLQLDEKVPAYQWKNLIGNTANLTQVAGFVLQLAELSGFLLR